MTTNDFAPSWAVTVWCDEASLYVSVPAKEGAPLIMKYTKSLEGHAKALEFANARFWVAASQGDGLTGSSNLPQLQGPKITRVVASRHKDTFTPEQRASAAGLLKKLGLTGR